MTLKILTVVGARPQFIKAAALSHHIQQACDGSVTEEIIHTGQHYDKNMSEVFFKQMGIPEPKYRFDLDKPSHGAMTAKMLTDIEDVLLTARPDVLLVYGDTNSTLAGALAAAKLHVPIAHVEAGLRSFNKRMPEEVNRVLTDHVSARLYCPTETACRNLAAEGITKGVMNSGDIMLDVAMHFGDLARNNSNIMDRLELRPNSFVLSTIHRAENTDVPERITEIFEALDFISRDVPVVLPLHPRTRKIAAQLGLIDNLTNLILVEPLPFWDILVLQQQAQTIITDSGGLQKEAYFNKKPCVTIRDETEWVETLEDGWNRLVAADKDAIIKAYQAAIPPAFPQKPYYGTGNTAKFIIDDLLGAF